MASYVMVGFTSNRSQEAEAVGISKESGGKECGTVCYSSNLEPCQRCNCKEEIPLRRDRKIDHVSVKGKAGRVALSNKTSGYTRERSLTAGDASDVRLDHLNKVLARSPDPVFLKKQDMKPKLHLLASEKKSNGDITSPSSSSSKRELHSHDHEREHPNTYGDSTPGVLKPEIDVERRRAQTSGSGDTDQLRSGNQYVDKTAVDSLKAHSQKKFVIRNAIWDEDGDISPNGPVLLRGSHQKLRLCRSLDPNILSSQSDDQQAEVENPQPGKNSRNRTEKPGSLKVRSSKQKRLLRSIKSVDSVVIPRSVDECSSDSSPTSPLGRLFSSPSTRRRFAYFSKLAAGMKVSGSHTSPDQAPRGDGEMRVGNEWPDFVSSPPSPSGIRKGKLPGPPSSSSRLMPRKLWKGKASKLSASPDYDTNIPQPAWSPLGNGVWQNTKGRRLQLFPKPLIHLSDIERRHLKIIAHQKLQQLNLGQVNIPRDLSELKKKKGGLLKGGRSKATHFFDSLRDGKDTKDSTSPLIFGIPLEKCMQNDQELRQMEAHRSRERRESLDLAQPVGLQTRRRSSRTLHDYERKRRCKAGFISSPQLSRKSSASSTALLEALSLSSSVNESHRRARRQSLAPNTDVRIPRVVSACFRFIEANGLWTEGIFRVSGSKKRVRQIRESYDRGDFVIFTREQSPHDVGALLKEYFRDLPEPLLTRDLYNVFTSSTKFETLQEKVSVVQMGVCLLPIVHRDVLYSLMRFLSKVAAEAERNVDSKGNEVAGSKMNAQNLGTLFGPNILKKTKGGLAPEKDKDLHADAAAHVERTRDVILTACLLIEHYEEIFQIPVSLQEEVLRMLSETDPDALDFIMNQRNLEMSFSEEPTQEEPMTTDFGTNPVDTTSSSSGTFPCVIEDSSLASLSTIEDLVNENNLSDFDGNLVSQGSSDSLDVLEEEEDAGMNVDYKESHEQNGPVSVHTRGQERFDYARQSNIRNGPSDNVTGISTVQDQPPRRGQHDAKAKESSHSLSPPHPHVKRGSIGLYAETMIALGMEVDRNGRDPSLKDEGGGDVNRNHRNPPPPCQTCLSDKEGNNNSKQPAVLLSSPHRQGPRHDMVEDRSAGVMSTPSTVSSSPLSGSTSSSNASLALSDSGIESKKRLPNYDEVLKIKELGVKNYVTVNSSKFFAPVPPMAEEEGLSSPSEEVRGHTSPERVPLNHNERKLTDEKSLPPYSRICRREHVAKTRHHHDSPPVYRRSPGTPNDESSKSKPFTEGFRGNVAPRAILTDYPPKISLYQTWNFLDLTNDDEGEFDGPETYV